MVDVFSQPEVHLLALLMMGLARTLLLRLVMVAALALVLRGSKPSERPVLLDSFAECLRQNPRTALRPRRRHDHAAARRT
ncbi:hypothetical protein ACN3XK_74435 [Actinomadura welshii]